MKIGYKIRVGREPGGSGYGRKRPVGKNEQSELQNPLIEQPCAAGPLQLRIWKMVRLHSQGLAPVGAPLRRPFFSGEGCFGFNYILYRHHRRNSYGKGSILSSDFPTCLFSFSPK